MSMFGKDIKLMLVEGEKLAGIISIKDMLELISPKFEPEERVLRTQLNALECPQMRSRREGSENRRGRGFFARPPGGADLEPGIGRQPESGVEE
jgi:hypothetical protein